MRPADQSRELSGTRPRRSSAVADGTQNGMICTRQTARARAVTAAPIKRSARFMAARKISDFTLGDPCSDGQMNWHGCKRPARRGRLGRRARTCTRWRAARRGRQGPGQVQRPRDRPTLTGRRSAAVLPRGGSPGPLSRFLSHSPPSGGVRRCPPRSCLRSSRTVADTGERRSALLESVLGASPRGFESRILRRPLPAKTSEPAVRRGWRCRSRSGCR